MIQCFLSFQSTQVMQLPVPPEKYEVGDPWKNQQVDGLQQSLNLIGLRGLRAISIDSFFPAEGHDYPFLQNRSMWGKQYVDTIRGWRHQRYPIRLVIIGSDYDVNMLVTIDDFKTSVGTDGDIGYTLTMTEYVLPQVG